METNIIFLIVLAVGVAILVWLRSWRQRRSLADKFAPRPPMEFETFYKRFYDGKIDRDKVRTHLNNVAEEFSVPADKLLPTDRFDVELKQPSGHEFDAGTGLLPMQVELLARAKGGMLKSESIVNVDDYITQMARYS
ncbi:hypothetical protein [Massilia cavernae]|uniref:Uncharacterized protein n=1 Tax=Massilia cavernae TaxID=2320864 RepID=A0A418XTD7_9BURK|nr:hypothetical protein [Massilia cavernae]RJG15918.1 hypothetical protein D3872_11980 [Massilia cavernae]